MTGMILDGREVAKHVKQQVASAVQMRRDNGQSVPGLDVILVGNNPSSATYVRHKQQACSEAGIRSNCHRLAQDASAEEIRELITHLNSSHDTHGILLQLPLPIKHPPEDLLELIHPHKDVDGFHPFNIGRLAQRRPLLRPCTPFGIITLMKSANIDLSGKHAVIVGASNIVGRPMALELLLEKCTVTVAHRFTHDLASLINQADILVAAIGNPRVIQSEWIKPNAIIIDVGFTHLANGKISGDIEFDSAIKKASWITPVPGGVGPMTVATLLTNTLQAARLIEDQQ